MEILCYGDATRPMLVCLHGLMGHVDDFRPFITAWQEHFFIIVPKLPDPKLIGYRDNDQFIYESTADHIAHALRARDFKDIAGFVGISFGGKLCYEIASRYPTLVKKMVVTDVSPGPLNHGTGLFNFMTNIVPEINLKQPWDNLRLELKNKIPDRMLRVLVQNHIEYADGPQGHGRWKSHGKEFPEILAASQLQDQWQLCEKMTARVVVLLATIDSAIRPADGERMASDKRFKLVTLPKTNHFIQIYAQESLKETVISEILLAD